MRKSKNRNSHIFDVVFFLAPKDVDIINYNIKNFSEKIKPRKIIIIGNIDFRNHVSFLPGVEYLDEDNLGKNLTLKNVRQLLSKKCGSDSRGNWYFQQFLKMMYALFCETEYYLVWDADTLLLNKINFWEETPTGDKCIFTLKGEYVSSYFPVLKSFFEGKVNKKINYSFIAEHMMINRNIMLELIGKMEVENNIEGTFFWEKIINAIRLENIYRGFSEFETYGNYVQTFYPDKYGFAELRSYRNGSGIFDVKLLNKDILKWLSQGLDTISFENWSYRGFFFQLSNKIIPLMVKYKIPYLFFYLFQLLYNEIYVALNKFVIINKKEFKKQKNNEKKIIIYIGLKNPFIMETDIEKRIFEQSRLLPENVDKYYLFIDRHGLDNTLTWKDFLCYGLSYGINPLNAFKKVLYKIMINYENPKVIVHSYNIFATIFFPRRTNILTIHSGLYYNSGKNRLFWIFFRIFVFFAAKKSNVISYTSENIKEMYKNYFNEK
jgi:hypothetical protein